MIVGGPSEIWDVQPERWIGMKRLRSHLFVIAGLLASLVWHVCTAIRPCGQVQSGSIRSDLFDLCYRRLARRMVSHSVWISCFLEEQ